MINQANLDFMSDSYKAYTHSSGVSKVGLIYEDDTIYESTNTACHAGLRYLGGTDDKKKKIKLIWSVYKTPHENFSVEGQEQFINWMVNKSPYADSFLLKDPKKIINGCWASDPEKPWDVVVAGSIATRFLSENYYLNHPPVWKELVDAGADETYAYALAQVYVASSNLYPIVPGSGDGHTSINFSGNGIGTTRNFIKNLRQTNHPSYQQHRSYSNLTGLFKDQHQTIEFRDWAVKTRPIEMKKHLSFNIFNQNKKKTTTISDRKELMSIYDQFVEAIG